MKWVLFLILFWNGNVIYAQTNRERILFLNCNNIDGFENTSIVMHHPVYRGIAFYLNKPWEGPSSTYTTILKEDGLFRAYYRGSYKIRDKKEVVTCIAESKNGIDWYKPNLKIYNLDGDSDNNVVLRGEGVVSHNFCPFLDKNPNCKPMERYKAVGGKEPDGLFLYVSEDGIHWKKIRDKAIYTNGNFDSQNLIFWDENLHCYLLFYRKWLRDEKTKKLYRSIATSRSIDLLNWEVGQILDFGDTPIENLYTNQISPYFRESKTLIGIGARFFENKRVIRDSTNVVVDKDYADDCSDVFLMSSTDGIHFDRTFMESFIRPGVGFNNWTSRTNYPALNVVQTSDDEMSIYVNENYMQKDACLARYSLRIDGFTSINAGYRGGTFVTTPIVVKDEVLEINYSTSAAGEVLVELLDTNNNVIKGFSKDDCNAIIGDEISKTVTWNNNSSLFLLKGEKVKVKFYMKDADVYSLSY